MVENIIERLLELQRKNIIGDDMYVGKWTNAEKTEYQFLKQQIKDNKEIIKLFTLWNETKLTDEHFAAKVIMILGTKRYNEISEQAQEEFEVSENK